MLGDSVVIKNINAANKENIKDIITTTAEKEKEKNAVADDVDFSNAELHCPVAGLCWLDATLHRPQCHTLAGETPHLDVSDATLHGCSNVAFPLFRCGIGSVSGRGIAGVIFRLVVGIMFGEDHRLAIKMQYGID